MARQSFEAQPQHHLRASGLMYLAIIVLGLFGEAVVRSSIVVGGDAGATLANISAREGLWRAGIAGDLLMHLLDVPVTVVLYLLLRPVSKPLALLATAFNIVQTAVLALNKANLVAPLLLLEASSTAGGSTAGIATLAYAAVQAHSHGFAIGLMFFGCTCIIRGHLILRSGYLPSFLGVLLYAAGAGYLLNSFALLALPDLASVLFPWVLLPAFVGELSFALWLVFKGVALPAWRERCAAAALDR